MNYTYGIYKLYVYTKSNIDVYLIPPGRFYNRISGISKTEIQEGMKYRFRIRFKVLQIDTLLSNLKNSRYGIYKKLSTKKTPCNHDLDWKEDTCKLSKVLTETSLKWLTVMMPIIENRERLERTIDRLEKD